MWTHSHFLVNAFVGDRLKRSCPVRIAPFLAGAVAPDVPLLVLTVGHAALRRLMGTAGAGEGLYAPGFDSLFYGHPVWVVGHNILHAPLVIGLLAALGWWSAGRQIRSGAPLAWFAAGCAIHTLIDIFTHYQDGPLLLFPFDWTYRFMSPVSYWHPDHFGIPAATVETGIDVAIVGYFALVYRRVVVARALAIARVTRSAAPLLLALTTLVSVAPGANGQSQVARAPVHRHTVVRIYPHDRQAWTQGLIYLDGFLYEGTGLSESSSPRGISTLRKVNLETGEVIQLHRLPSHYFGEGITNWSQQLVQLTWRSNIGFVYDRTSFALRRTFTYTGEGWGLTHDGTRLIMSDGTATLRFLDPRSFQETGRLAVRDGGVPVDDLNELEYVRGEIYANVWQTERIAIIAPRTGQVTAWIDLSGLLSARDRELPVDVLNGIAYDARADRLFVTGKLWPKLFEIKISRQ